MHIEFPILLGTGLVLLGVFYLGFLSLKIKFPAVILYILFGIIIADFVSENEVLHIASEIGIVLLFFILGLEFSVSRLGGIAKKIWSSGLLDFVLSFGVAMLISLGFGMDPLSAFIVGGIAYATSSSITAKLLDDKGRMANGETEFMLGILIFEDLVAPILVSVLFGITSGGSFTAGDAYLLAGKIIGLIIIAVLIGKLIRGKFGSFLDSIEDEDFRYALLVGIALAYGGLALYLDLSEVLGAFLAGVMLAEIGRIHMIEQIVIPVRDLMLPTFFIYFGTSIEFGEGIPMPLLLIVLLLWSVIAKVILGVIGGRWYGLPKKAALRAGLSMCARGEFSVVIAGVAAGSLKVFGGIYIIFAAFIGMILFEKAPELATKVYGKSKPKKKNLKVPGS